MRVKALILCLTYSIKEEFEKEVLRTYVTDALYAINQNTARVTNAHMEKRFFYLIHPENEDTRTGDDIALEVMQNAGLRFDDGST